MAQYSLNLFSDTYHVHLDRVRGRGVISSFVIDDGNEGEDGDDDRTDNNEGGQAII